MISNFPLVRALDTMSHEEFHHLGALVDNKQEECLLSTVCLPLLLRLLFIIHNYNNIIVNVLPELGSIIRAARARVLLMNVFNICQHHTTAPQHTELTQHCTMGIFTTLSFIYFNSKIRLHHLFANKATTVLL